MKYSNKFRKENKKQPPRVLNSVHVPPFKWVMDRTLARDFVSSLECMTLYDIGRPTWASLLTGQNRYRGEDRTVQYGQDKTPAYIKHTDILRNANAEFLSLDFPYSTRHGGAITRTDHTHITKK